MPGKVLIAGLGNPGKSYAGSRHNIGFWLVDQLAEKHSAQWQSSARFHADVSQVSMAETPCLLMKPQTFMNRSGDAIRAWCQYHQHPIDKVIVIYDDLTLDTARAKLSVGGSAGGHNGIRSILSQIDNTFCRYRLGIGAKPHRDMDLADYVLSPISRDDWPLYDAQVETYLSDLTKIIELGPSLAMNTINQTSKPS